MRTPFVFNCHGLPAGVFFSILISDLFAPWNRQPCIYGYGYGYACSGFFFTICSLFSAFFQPFFLLSARFVTRRVEFQGLRLWHTRLGLRITGYGLGTKGGFWRHPALRSIKIKITFTGVNCQPTRIAEEFVESKDLKESQALKLHYFVKYFMLNGNI